MSNITVCIVGMGLIGGSLAKTMRRYYPNIRILGYNRTESVIELAYKDGVINNTCNPSLDEIGKSTYIFLCLPVIVNTKFLTDLKPYLSDDTVLTDAGSVKGDICDEVEKLGLSSQFIGGHPMAGSEKSGYDASSADLYVNAYYLLTPSDSIPKTKVQSFYEFIKGFRCIPYILDAKSHDQFVAAISHLPHAVAFALVAAVASIDDPNEVLPAIAAGGFRDTTRIAASDPTMWEEIFLSNKDAILPLIDLYQEKLAYIRDIISNSNGSEIKKYISNAKEYRDSLPVRSKGPASTEYCFYTDIEDVEGSIAKVATILADAHISIKDMNIIHNREFVWGVLRLAFYDNDSCEKAIKLLKENKYTIRRS